VGLAVGLIVNLTVGCIDGFIDGIIVLEAVVCTGRWLGFFVATVDGAIVGFKVVGRKVGFLDGNAEGGFDKMETVEGSVVGEDSFNVGFKLGCDVNFEDDGVKVGNCEGLLDIGVSVFEGDKVGMQEVSKLGKADGILDGTIEDRKVGLTVGRFVGESGDEVGLFVGERVVGRKVGIFDGI